MLGQDYSAQRPDTFFLATRILDRVRPIYDDSILVGILELQDYHAVVAYRLTGHSYTDYPTGGGCNPAHPESTLHGRGKSRTNLFRQLSAFLSCLWRDDERPDY